MNKLVVLNEDELRSLIRETLSSCLSEHLMNEKDSDSDNSTEILTPQQAADFLGVKLSSIYKYSMDGIIPKIKRGKRLYFQRSQLIEWLKDGSVSATVKNRRGIR